LKDGQKQHILHKPPHYQSEGAKYMAQILNHKPDQQHSLLPRSDDENLSMFVVLHITS
jgi:hypothetical protein|tara:strand:- start:2561 stop:2734 length:174 start_codon:yes stop_codon:yes gene_type:complete